MKFSPNLMLKRSTPAALPYEMGRCFRTLLTATTCCAQKNYSVISCVESVLR